MTYFKTFGAGGLSREGRWRRPETGWLPPIADPAPYRDGREHGYHVYRGPEQLLSFLDLDVWEVDVRGAVVEANGKCLVESVRLVRRVAAWGHLAAGRLFAADCAARALYVFEWASPSDATPRHAIETARRHARGEATDEGLRAACIGAWRAADRAPCIAARSAAYSCRAAATEPGPAASAAAAYAADAVASWAADGDAARAVERQWQAERLDQCLRGMAPEKEDA